MKGVKTGQLEDSAQAPCHSCTNCTAQPVSARQGPPFEFAGKMSREFWPPRTPVQWEVLTDEEDRVEETTGNDDSDLESAEKFRVCRLIL